MQYKFGDRPNFVPQSCSRLVCLCLGGITYSGLLTNSHQTTPFNLRPKRILRRNLPKSTTSLEIQGSGTQARIQPSLWSSSSSSFPNLFPHLVTKIASEQRFSSCKCSRTTIRRVVVPALKDERAQYQKTHIVVAVAFRFSYRIKVIWLLLVFSSVKNVERVFKSKCSLKSGGEILRHGPRFE